MTSRDVPDARPLAGEGSGVQVNLERTGEGVGYRTVAEPAAAATPVVAPAPLLATAHDRVRWQSILAGLFTTITVLVVLMVLGLAVGISVFGKAGTTGGLGPAAWGWSIGSGVLAFLAGGWVAGETAAVSSVGNAILNGFLVGAAALVLVLWLGLSGFSNLLGAVGGNLTGLAQLALSHGTVQQLGGAAQQAQQAAASNSGQAVSIGTAATWGAWVTIVVGLILAALGGWIGFAFRGVRLPFNERV
ncbi:MAG TPA: hypothetical protein VFA70_15390 [Dehalococcoidia bacterium]|nr:hypothetical protein [Dehalococcoidia bacterium]